MNSIIGFKYIIFIPHGGILLILFSFILLKMNLLKNTIQYVTKIYRWYIKEMYEKRERKERIRDIENIDQEYKEDLIFFFKKILKISIIFDIDS